ncbi:hypothetical protein G7Z17_g12016 [Cylindrodendrum hubeiense]|uniref:Uncharacterized protein n=1 Tax=Cylindrodendrum hubeiense TaxID=595255 RepID=A0A9P5H3X7_9HYPO|nr:hypothetical protein G7Z17_g12016 [Cylindrodendrum hubeiense]
MAGMVAPDILSNDALKYGSVNAKYLWNEYGVSTEPGDECELRCELHTLNEALASIWCPQLGGCMGVNAAVVAALPTNPEHIIPWEWHGRRGDWESTGRQQQNKQNKQDKQNTQDTQNTLNKQQMQQMQQQQGVSATPGGPSNGPCISPAVPSPKEPQNHATKVPNRSLLRPVKRPNLLGWSQPEGRARVPGPGAVLLDADLTRRPHLGPHLLTSPTSPHRAERTATPQPPPPPVASAAALGPAV